MIFNQNKPLDFDSIKLKLASPEVMKNWSHGEVLKPETINYRTQKPEKDGLFCERIFGPSKDWECYCGKYKKIRYKGIICDKCGVEVTHSIVRRERMGHIELAAPVSHIWFLRGVPSRLGLVLDISAQNLEKVIYFANFIVTKVDEDLKKQAQEQLKAEYKTKKKQIESNFKNQVNQIKKDKNLKVKDKDKKIIELNKEKEETLKELETEFVKTEADLKELKVKNIISEEFYHDLSLKFGYLFEASIGAEAIRKLLTEIDLEKLVKKLQADEEDTIGAKKDRIVKRLKLIKNLAKNDIRPEWMILNVIPVIPPDLRPMVPLDGGRFATSDLNDLYRRVINRNNRLKKLKELNAPEVIIRNEKRMLQEAVDALVDNSARHSKTTTASTGQKRQLKSIADILKGKQGRFRQNLLGKRIDYSGRSVIVVGPNLPLDECGLPKRMALELFKPFVISQLIKREFVHNIRSANRFIESGRPEVWDILEEIVKDAHVLLNRAPTLHRLGIQAFRPTLIEGKAIQLHPLVCSAFNADFDGDQMAVHVPLTEQAKEEAKEIMLSKRNLLKPATGNPITTPKMDIVWGCYYITSFEDIKEEPRAFASCQDAILAYRSKIITIRERIKVKTILPDKDQPEIIETNVGRIFFNKILPEGMPFYNEQIHTKKLGQIIKYCLELLGKDATAKLLDDVKDLGYYYLTKSGYSWGMDDLPVLEQKQALIEQGDKIIDEVNEQYEQGLLTKSERHSKIIEIWTGIKDKIVQISQDSLDKEGPVYSMVTAGARGSWGQVTQMVGMKGLVSNPAGEIIELPVKASFKEGFGVLEYFISTHGSRKGLSDTALRTANAGYLTRRLVDVAQDVVIREEDCGDKQGIVYTKKESEEIGVNLLERVWGRVCLDKITHPETDEVIINKNEIISDEVVRKLKDLDLEQIIVRSVLACKLSRGICKKCYGYDLGYNELAKLGTAVGIVAAQSIGEPGTQLTMRTFHTGGVAGSDITQGLPRVEELFEARPPKRKAFIADVEGVVSITEASRKIEDEKGQVLLSTTYGQKIIKIKYDELEEDIHQIKDDKAIIKVKEGQKVKKGDVLFKQGKKEVKAKKDGVIKLTEKTAKVIAQIEREKEYLIPPGYRIWVKDGDFVKVGEQLTEGSLDLRQLYKLKGKDEVKKYIVKEIQYIYSSQGQKLNEKHIEVIIKQLFSRCLVNDSGDTNLLPAEIIESSELEEANAEIRKGKGKEATAEELFLGITKVSLSTRSFLSAASFQETSRVLINAAVTGKVDTLDGLKENVIIGRLIPAGTGFKKKSKDKK
ncbi:MAG: DNA-directed RNA polymerase subunit beta' [Candidatus Buchananbacteria bacterium]|nr:DNA-directed RNA polymerase subunit beta' [Candidatus Buchananbacteria bacterium]